MCCHEWKQAPIQHTQINQRAESRVKTAPEILPTEAFHAEQAGIRRLVTLLTFCALADASHAAPPSVMRQQANTVRGGDQQERRHDHPAQAAAAKGATGPVSTMALSRDERFLITANGDNSLRPLGPSAGREVAKLTGHATPAAAVAISPTRFGRLGSTAGKSASGIWPRLANRRSWPDIPAASGAWAFPGTGERFSWATRPAG